MAGVILLIDFLSGVYVQLAILFVIPVTLAAWGNGRRWGIAVALVLPFLRFWLTLTWRADVSPLLLAVDQMIDASALTCLALLIDRLVVQARELRVLEGMLPICSFCKRIRGEDQTWHRLETFITDRSKARFSHTFCPECGLQHYGDELVRD